MEYHSFTNKATKININTYFTVYTQNFKCTTKVYHTVVSYSWNQIIVWQESLWTTKVAARLLLNQTFLLYTDQVLYLLPFENLCI